MMATLRRFIALLLTGPIWIGRFQLGHWLERDLTGKPEPTFPGCTQNLECDGALIAQKGSPAKRTGHTLRVAAQYSQKSPENNVLFAI
jgi:hypothetical protein